MDTSFFHQMIRPPSCESTASSLKDSKVSHPGASEYFAQNTQYVSPHWPSPFHQDSAQLSLTISNVVLPSSPALDVFLRIASELSTEHGTLATPTAVCLSFIIDCVAAAVYPIFHSAQSLPSASSPSPSSYPKNCGHQAHITLPSTPPISKTFPTKSPTSIRRNHTLLSRFSLKHRSKPPAKHQLHQRANRAPKNPKVSSPTQNSSLSQVMSSAAI